MTKREALVRALDGKTDDEKKEYLRQNFSMYCDIPDGPCKVWFSKVFTYCTAEELDREMNFFLFLISLIAFYWNICFEEEDLVFLGCTCPCGNKQCVLFFSFTCAD